jgi:NAD(P)-dependent dehydrogenase (short-subunit alcohol dehydrogenase family)
VPAKTILITGSSSGIGLEGAVVLAREGARVVLVGRDAARTDAAVAQVKQRSGSALVESLLCDFSSQASIRRLAGEVLARYPRLDVLVNNAGGVHKARTVTEDGIEATFAVNHLGYFLLTNLLLDRLIASAPARIVNVASVGHYNGTLDFDDLGFARGGYSIRKAYSRSKLANVLFTRLLARKLKGQGVTVNAVHPGAVATNIWSGAPRLAHPILAVAKLFMLSPADGAQTLTYLAASAEVEGQTGLYFEKNRPRQPAPLAQDDALAERLWAESARLTHLVA